MLFILSLDKHCLSPYFVGPFLSCLGTGVSNPCLSRDLKFNGDTEEMRMAPVVSTAVRKGVGRKEGGSPLHGRRELNRPFTQGKKRISDVEVSRWWSMGQISAWIDFAWFHNIC